MTASRNAMKQNRKSTGKALLYAGLVALLATTVAFHPVVADSPSYRLEDTPTYQVFLPAVSKNYEKPSLTGSFTPENLACTHFDNPQSATWALLNRTSPGFKTSELEGATIDVMINGTHYCTIPGQDALDQIELYEGILVDYDEGQFDTPMLSVSLGVRNQNGAVIYQNTEDVPNWAQVGLLQFPQNHETGESVLMDQNVIIHELDDIDPSVEGLLSSLTPKLFGPAHVDHDGVQLIHVSGFKYGETEGSAFDLAYRYVLDPTKTFLSFPKNVDLTYFQFRPLQEDPSKAESVFGFVLGVNVLVEDNGKYTIVPVHGNMGHQKISAQDTPYVYTRGESLSTIPAGVVFGVIEKGDGNPGGLNFGIRAEYCSGNSDCSGEPDDPNSLILPIAVFFSQEVRDLALEAFYRGDPVEIPRH